MSRSVPKHSQKSFQFHWIQSVSLIRPPGSYLCQIPWVGRSPMLAPRKLTIGSAAPRTGTIFTCNTLDHESTCPEQDLHGLRMVAQCTAQCNVGSVAGLWQLKGFGIKKHFNNIIQITRASNFWYALGPKNTWQMQSNGRTVLRFDCVSMSPFVDARLWPSLSWNLTQIVSLERIRWHLFIPWLWWGPFLGTLLGSRAFAPTSWFPGFPGSLLSLRLSVGNNIQTVNSRLHING